MYNKFKKMTYLVSSKKIYNINNPDNIFKVSYMIQNPYILHEKLNILQMVKNRK